MCLQHVFERRAKERLGMLEECKQSSRRTSEPLARDSELKPIEFDQTNWSI